jgi:hypothetical protein
MMEMSPVYTDTTNPTPHATPSYNPDPLYPRIFPFFTTPIVTPSSPVSHPGMRSPSMMPKLDKLPYPPEGMRPIEGQPNIRPPLFSPVILLLVAILVIFRTRPLKRRVHSALPPTSPAPPNPVDIRLLHTPLIPR